MGKATQGLDGGAIGGNLSYSHMKVNSTLWGMMIENGVGKNLGNPQAVV